MPDENRVADDAEEKAFKEQLFAAALQAGLRIKSYTPDLAVIDYHGEDTQFSMRAVRARWRAMPPQQREYILFLQLTAPFEERISFADATFDEVRTQLLPRMGPPNARAERNPTAAPPSLPLVEGFLHVYLVVNERASMWFVTEHQEKRWGMTLEDLLPVAIENLRAQTDLKHLERVTQMDAYFFSSGDSYDSARALLLRELLTPFPAKGVVVLMPTREHLLFTPVESPDAWTNVAKLVGVMRQAYAGAAYPVSDQAFWFDGRRWVLLPVEGEGDRFHMRAPQEFLDALGGKPSPG